MRFRLLLIAVMLIGCKSTPEVKPAKTAETLVSPPQGDRRYDYPIYPKEAMNHNDRKKDAANGPPNMMAGGMNGMGGMGGMGGMNGR